MKVDGVAHRSIRRDDDGVVRIIDQTRLPHKFERRALTSLDDAVVAIAAMQVRGAPLIGATAAFGLALALRDDPSDAALEEARRRLLATRPTAVNLAWALRRVGDAAASLPPSERADAALAMAEELADADVRANRAIGEHGLELLRELAEEGPHGPVNVMTHCNAGWLATVDWGTATAPIYRAHDEGLSVHVWVSETRPRGQGAGLTAWELKHHGVPHTVVVDNAAGHLMRRGLVDLVLVGTDRTTANGDVVNKIGTYLKALAARDTGVPFWVAAPTSSIDPAAATGDDVPIEERSGEEVSRVTGRSDDGATTAVRVVPEGSPVSNPGFDVTPARLITGLITERGTCDASGAGLAEVLGDGAGAGGGR